MKHGVWCVLAALVLAGCSEPLPPNIVIIYIDDLGWRDLAIMGSEYYETPNIDRLAAEGMVFTNAYANAPNCAPSRACLISGQYSPRHGIYTVHSAAQGDSGLRRLIPVENRTELDPAVTTIAEALSPAGYVSGHIGKWHLGGPGHQPEDQGFAVSIGVSPLGTVHDHFCPYGTGDHALSGLDEDLPGEYLTDRLTDEAIGFVETQRARPFFLYLSHYAVHRPIRGKPEIVAHFREKPPATGHSNPEYAAMIKSIDIGVGRILQTLDELDLARRTVVVLYGDNGGSAAFTSMAPLRGAKGMLYEGGIREPLIVRWPGRIAEGSVCDTPVIGTDLYATIIAMAGTRPPKEHTLDGVDLAPLFAGRELPARALFWHFPAYLRGNAATDGPWRTTPVSAVRLGRYKLIRFFEDERLELYDLTADIGESVNLASTMSDKTDELATVLQEWYAATGAFVPSEPNPAYDPSYADSLMK